MLIRSNNKSTLTLSQTKGFVAQRHPFHILETSPFPFLTGFFLLTLLMPLTFSLHGVDLLGLPRAEIFLLFLLLTATSCFTSSDRKSFFPKLQPLLCTISPAVQKAAEEVTPHASSTTN